MEITQDKQKFNPIHVKLDTQVESDTFFNLVKKIESYYCNEGEQLELTIGESRLIADLCNLYEEKGVKCEL